MTSYKGFVRLPPIGEIGLPCNADNQSNSVKEIEVGKNVYDSTLNSELAAEDDTANHVATTDKNQHVIVDLQHDTRSKNAKLSPRRKKTKFKIPRDERTLSKKELIGPDAHFRDSGLDSNTTNESIGKSLDQGKIIVPPKSTPRRSLSVNSETKLNISNEDESREGKNDVEVYSYRKENSRQSNSDENASPVPTLSDVPACINYKEMAIRMANSYSRPQCPKRSRTFVDYVLFFESDDISELFEEQRQNFEKTLEDEKISIVRTKIGKRVYVELCCSFERLCEEAEAIFLQMPLVGVCSLFFTYQIWLQRDNRHTNNHIWFL